MISNILKAQLLGTNHWTIDLRNLEVEDQEGWIKDKPYVVQIGYRVKLGENCTVYTELINGPFFSDTKYKQDLDYAIPKSVGMMQFPEIKDPPAYNKTGNPIIDLAQLGPTVNFINNNGLILYGTIIVAMRDGKLMSADEQKLIFEALRMDVHNLLEEVVADPAVFSGQVSANNVELKIKDAISSFFSSAGKMFSKVSKAVVGFRENIVGVHVIILANVSSGLTNSIESALLPLVKNYISNNFLNNFKTELINLPHYIGKNNNTYIGTTTISAQIDLGSINNLKNFNIGYIDIDAMNWAPSLGIDGRFSVSATIGGTGNYQFYQNQLGPIRFKLLKESSNNTKAVIDITGAINKSTGYQQEANHVNPSECVDYCTPQKIVNDFSYDKGWTDAGIFPRTFADVDGDGKIDIIGFGHGAVMVSLNKGSYFQAPQWAISQFCVSQNYIDNNKHPRIVKDINKDGKADIIGFGPNGIQIAYGNSNGTFNNFKTLTSDFTQKRPYQSDWPEGWSDFYNYPRFIEDMNGDGWPDIIGFANNAVWVVLNNNGFSSVNGSHRWVNNFTKAQGWQNTNNYMRLVADMNNDGKADIVGFGGNGVYVSLTNSSGIGAVNPVLWSSDFGQTNEWTENEKYPRFLNDMNNDGLLDIIGFGHYDTKVALNSGNSFGNTDVWSSEFGTFEGWGDYQSHPKFIGDINGDGFQDFLSIGSDEILVGLGDGIKIKSHKYFQSLDLKNYISNTISIIPNFLHYKLTLPANQASLPKVLVNYDKSDNSDEVVIFGDDGVYSINCNNSKNAFRTAKSEEFFDETLGNKNIKIFPNPNSGIFTVLNDSDNFLVNVYDAMGRLILSQLTKENRTIIDLSDKNYKGLLLINVINKRSDSIHTEKIFIQ
jgi:hypothetical protein